MDVIHIVNDTPHSADNPLHVELIAYGVKDHREALTRVCAVAPKLTEDHVVEVTDDGEGDRLLVRLKHDGVEVVFVLRLDPDLIDDNSRVEHHAERPGE